MRIHFWVWERFSCIAVYRGSALRFHQKYLNLCSEDEQGSYGFETTQGWVINDIIKIFGRNLPLNPFLKFDCKLPFRLHSDCIQPMDRTKFCPSNFFFCLSDNSYHLNSINISLYVTICCYIHSIATSTQNIHIQKSNSLSNVSWNQTVTLLMQFFTRTLPIKYFFGV